MENLATCAHCGADLKEGVFGTNRPLQPVLVEAINLAFEEERSSACNKCGGKMLIEARDRLDQKISRLRDDLVQATSVVPMISIHSPDRWEYDCIDLVTAQSTTGTGILSDVASAFTDFVGAQSKSYNNKIRLGENLCRAALRMQTIELGGNAILAVDVDYAEVGGQRAMLMVCMTGTAVTITNSNIVLPQLEHAVESLRNKYQRLTEMEKARSAIQVS